MSTTAAGVLFLLSMVAALAVSHRFLGDYMYRVVTGTTDSRAERGIYRLVGVNPRSEQSWPVYARSILAFSAVSILFLYAFMRLQAFLPLSLGFPGVMTHGAWNTAVSFVTNTNWQWYSGESTMGHLVQMAGLAVQNFASAAVGIAVAVALVRGFARRRTDQLGNFWVDLTRITLRVLLPISVVAAVVLTAGGAVQNLSGGTDVTTLGGALQHITGGPVASQEAIKELGTNGGGFYNANSSHPFENPTSWTNWLEIFLLLVIPFSLPRVFGRMVGQPRQGYAILAAMAVLAIASICLTVGFELAHNGTVPQAVGAAVEGKETRFGVVNSAVFAAATTLTSTGVGELVPRLLHRPRRHDADHQHDARRGRSRRRRSGPVRHARAGRGHGVRGRADGRPHPRVHRQEDRRPRDQVRVPVLPDHTGARADRRRGGDGHLQPRHRAQRGPARLLRGAVRVRVGGQQQRLGVRRHHGEHAVVEHRPWSGDAAGQVRADHSRAGPGRVARQAAAGARVGWDAAHPPALVRRACWSA